MANSKGEGSISNPNDEQILKDLVSKMIEEVIKNFMAKVNELLEDLISKMNQFEEDFKKFLEELDKTQSAMRMKEEKMLHVAELAKRMTKPDARELVILAFQKKKEDSNNSSYTLIEMMIGSFKDYLKDRGKAEIGSVENYEECTLEELLNKLSEIAQQVIDSKHP